MMKKFGGILAAFLLMAAPTPGIAAMAGTNTVNSAAIVDGAVATADIANRAVTAAKIADSTITATQLANGAVTATKLAPGAVAGGNLADGSVTTAKIANGSITDTKISGPISASKIAPGVFQQKYANIVVVAKNGGDFTDPMAAMAAITADEWNPVLLKIMPGAYNIGQNTLVLKNFVDIEGSGEGTTRIVGSNDTLSGVIAGAANSELRFLTVENTGGGQVAVALSLSGAAMKCFKVTFKASGGTNQVYALSVNANATIDLDNVAVNSSSSTQVPFVLGLWLNGASTANIVNSRFNGSGGSANWFSLVEYASTLNLDSSKVTSIGSLDDKVIHSNYGTRVNITNSILESGEGVYTYSGTTRVANTQIINHNGTAIINSSGAQSALVGNYDANFSKNISIYDVSGNSPPVNQ